MSRLAGLTKNIQKKNGAPSAPDASTTTIDSDAPPSLSALASGVKPRQNLTSLAAGAATGGSNGRGLSSLGARKGLIGSNNHGSSLQELAKGSNNVGAGLARPAGGLTRLVGASSSANSSKNNSSFGQTGLGPRLGGTSERPSLAALAHSRDATGPVASEARSDTNISNDSPSTSSSTSRASSSLAELSVASQNAAPPRKSLASLASPNTSSTNKLTQSGLPSSSISTSGTTYGTGLTGSSLGLTARAGATLSDGEPRGDQKSAFSSKLTASHSMESSSPSLSSLASSSLQPRKPLPSVSNPSKPLSEKSQASKNIASYTQETSENEIAVDMNSQSEGNAVEQAAARTNLADDILTTSEQGEDSTPAVIGFSSMIAPPSHFALSIFEKLEPTPSPIALSTASLLQATNPELLLRRIKLSSEAGKDTGTVTPARVFQFDTPSPDDIVFKAQSQGHRPSVMSGR
ncbi:hypothetical protein BX616_006420 [Lobosporangium transversale]|nr:hypothetical protein BX616_006420 [Lobosporangium transversale]